MGAAWERHGLCELALRVEVFKRVKLYIVFVWGMPLCSLVLLGSEEGSTLCGRAGRLLHHSTDIQVRKWLWPVSRYP
jgi:hypothetical protein